MTDTDMRYVFRSVRAFVPEGFAYDSEHPQLQIPFTARIGDRRMEGKSLSVTHAVVSGLLPPSLDSGRQAVTLRFDFDGFSVNLFVDCHVTREGATDNANIYLRFYDPTAGHLAPLRYILNSYIAGDLVSIGQMLGYCGPTEVEDKPQAAARTLKEKVAKNARRGVVVALSVALIALAANVVHKRVFFKYEPRPVLFAQAGETLRATAAGQITYTNPRAIEGDVAYSISATNGDFLSVKMPCDCQMQPLEDFYDGATILAGTPLVRLVKPDAPLEAEAIISLEGVARAFAGDQAQLELEDGRIVPVDLSLRPIEGEAPEPGAMVADVILSDEAAQALTEGQATRLRFRRNILPDFLTGRVGDTPVAPSDIQAADAS